MPSKHGDSTSESQEKQQLVQHKLSGTSVASSFADNFLRWVGWLVCSSVRPSVRPSVHPSVRSARQRTVGSHSYSISATMLESFLCLAGLPWRECLRGGVRISSSFTRVNGIRFRPAQCKISLFPRLESNDAHEFLFQAKPEMSSQRSNSNDLT